MADCADAREKMRLALDLSEDAERIELQNLRRRHPNESPQQIELRLIHWLHTRPGAEGGDGVGRRVDRFGRGS